MMLPKSVWQKTDKRVSCCRKELRQQTRYYV